MLDKDISISWAVITEYIVSFILNDCINYNKIKFNSPYDLHSTKYGNINVKSRKIYKKKYYNNWFFSKNVNSKIPDHYICLGFDEDKTLIERVWIIPGDAEIVTKRGIMISNSKKGLLRVSQYEVDHAPYNNAFKNLNIEEMEEFKNK